MLRLIDKYAELFKQVYICPNRIQFSLNNIPNLATFYPSEHGPFHSLRTLPWSIPNICAALCNDITEGTLFPFHLFHYERHALKYILKNKVTKKSGSVITLRYLRYSIKHCCLSGSQDLHKDLKENYQNYQIMELKVQKQTDLTQPKIGPFSQIS